MDEDYMLHSPEGRAITEAERLFVLDGDFGVVDSPAFGDLTVTADQPGDWDGRGVYRVSRNGTPLGKVRTWCDGSWHAEISGQPLGGSQESAVAAVALFYGIA